MRRDVRGGYQNITSERGKRQKLNSFFCGCGTFSEWGLNGRKNSQKGPEIHVHQGAHWVLEAPVEQREELLHLWWPWHPKAQGFPAAGLSPFAQSLQGAPSCSFPRHILLFIPLEFPAKLHPSGTGQLSGTHQTKAAPELVISTVYKAAVPRIYPGASFPKVGARVKPHKVNDLQDCTSLCLAQ